MDIINTPPSDETLQAPWISVRLSWASDEHFPAAIRFLMGICDELDMVLYSGDTIVTGSNLNSLIEDFFKSAGQVVETFGRCRQSHIDDKSQ